MSEELYNVLMFRDINGKVKSIPMENEEHVILNNKILLNYIPDRNNKVIINGMYEVKQGHRITDNTQFKVDYSNGEVTFHADENNTTIVITKYFGIGIIKVYASRVIDSKGGSVDTSKSLQDYIDSVKPYGYKGEYSSSYPYEANSMISYDYGIYRCKQKTLGIAPTNSDYWEVMFSARAEANYAKAQGDYAKSSADGILFTSEDFTPETITVNNDIAPMVKNELNRIDSQMADIVYNAKLFGAKCDGVTDDIVALKNAKVNIPSGSTLLIPSNCVISDTLLIDKDINFISKGDIIYTGTRDKKALHFKRVTKSKIEIHNVKDKSTNWHGWSNNEYVGIAFENLIYCDVKVATVCNFTTGVRFIASGGIGIGHFFNSYDIFQLYNNKIQMDFYLDGSQSWLNANVFKNTIFTYDQSGIEFQTANVDRYCIKDTHVNGNGTASDANIFYDLKWDTMTEFGGTYSAIHLERAWNWKFENYRLELVSGTNVKFAVLDCQYNEVKGIVFNPLLELYTSPVNANVSLINNTNPTISSDMIYQKKGVNSNIVDKQIHTDKKFHERFRKYAEDFRTIKGVYRFDVAATALSSVSETAWEYGYGGISNNGVTFGKCGVLYLKNINKNDVIKVNLNSAIGVSDNEISIKCWDNSNNFIDNNVINGVKAVASSDTYWDSSNKRLKQSSNSGEFVFSVNSQDVKTVAILYNGTVDGIIITTNNPNISVLKSIIDIRQNTEYHRVHVAPTVGVSGGNIPGEILLNDSTSVGQDIGWQLQVGTLNWVSLGKY